MTYDPAVGRWLTMDPIGFEAGDANLYRYVGNDSAASVDPDGLSKKKVVGWVVSRVGGKLVKVATVFTEEQAARMFIGKCATHGFDLLLRDGGREGAKKIARIIQDKLGQNVTGKLLEGGTHLGHPIRNQLGELIGVGTRHIQFDNIAGRHIFYSALAIALGVAAEGEAAEGDYSIDVTEIYHNPYPGTGQLDGLTVEYWCGEDSIGRHLDWINPLALLALGNDVGRQIDQELWKELIGYTVTIRDDKGEPLVSITLGPDGEPISQTPWIDGKPGEPVALDPMVENDG